MLNNQQKAIIHVAQAQLGWDDDTYRDVLKNHGGATSSTDLDYAGFKRVMRHAEKCGFKNKKSQSKCKKQPATRNSQRATRMKYESLGHRPGYASPAQLRKIEVLWRNAARDPSDQALRIFLHNQVGVSRIEWLREEHVTPVLSVIKAMQTRKRESAKGMICHKKQ